MSSKKFLVSIIGGYKCEQEFAKLAEDVGEIIAREGLGLVCGGRSGIMEAACKGAKKAGGLTVGIIPGEDKKEANEYVDVVIATGMGYSRNAIVAGTADLVVAFPGKYGTLSEIGFALNSGKEVYGFGTWDIEGVVKLEKPEELREILKKALSGKR
ncbi:MAG: TIGR00725 family protein [Candidatus Omnitrophota bacterium]